MRWRLARAEPLCSATAENRTVGNPTAGVRGAALAAGSREPAVLTRHTLHALADRPRTRGRSLLYSSLFPAPHTPGLNGRRSGAGQRPPAGFHFRAHPLNCVLEAPASPRCASLAPEDWGLAAEAGWRLQRAGRLPFSLAAPLAPLAPPQPAEQGQSRGVGGTSGLSPPCWPELFVDYRLRKNRRATAVAWHCLQIAAPPWGRPAWHLFACARLWRRSPGQAGRDGRQVTCLCCEEIPARPELSLMRSSTDSESRLL